MKQFKPNNNEMVFLLHLFGKPENDTRVNSESINLYK
jgi:hypothetical protein